MTIPEDKLQGVILGRFLADYYPPTLRRDIYEREVLFEKFDQPVDTVLSFGDPALTVSRSTLYAAARESFSKNLSVQIVPIDENNGNQNLVFEPRDDGFGAFNVVAGDKKYRLFDLWMLTGDIQARSTEFERLASKYNLPIDEIHRLTNIVTSTNVSDREVDLLMKAFENTPIRTFERISEDTQHGKSEVDSLIPPNEEYYAQLVGRYRSTPSFEEFATRDWFAHLQGHMKPDTIEGLRLALRCSAHQSITSLLGMVDFDYKVVEVVLTSIENPSDLISKIGVVEYIVPYLAEYPGLRDSVFTIINQLRDDNPENSSGLYHSFSKIYAFVEGELSRLKLFEHYSPFYRRFASIAQTALIQDSILNSKIKISHFTDWAWGRGAQNFYFQNLFDLRSEPYWVPEYSNPGQWKSEIIGRLFNVANNNIKLIEDDEELKRLLLDFDGEELKKYADFPGPFIPGPLEGHHSMPPILPEKLEKDLESALDAETVDYKSFVSLVSFSRFFRLNPDHADRAVKALALTHDNILIEKEENFYDLMLGFASVAGVTKSTELADQIRVLIRKFGQLGASNLVPSEIFRIATIAAAAHEDLEGWCKYIGEFTFELANSDFDDDQLEGFYSSLRCLLDVVPELWATCGNSERALFSLFT